MIRYNKYNIRQQQSIQNRMNMKFGNRQLVWVVVLLILHRGVCGFCTTNCTYELNTTGAAHYDGLCSGSPSTCTGCDTRFSFLVGSTCKLYPWGIYNDTFVIQAKDWQPTISTSVPSFVNLLAGITTDWREFKDAATIVYLKQMLVPYYGIRCRTLFHVQGTGFWPSVFFYLNTTIYGQQIEMSPALNSHYNQQQWIYTSKFIGTSDSSLLLRLLMSLPATVGIGQHIAFRQTTCMVAYCVTNCASCTSLTDCSGCVSGYYLDIVLRQCNTLCPAGQYKQVNAATSDNYRICKLCSPYCDECSGTATTCTNCVDHGQYQSYLYQSACYVTCPNSYIPNEHNHTCDCPSGYYVNGVVCTLCHIACLNCTAAGSTNCIVCNVGYFQNAVATTTCSLTCPTGQYSTCIDDINKCYLCNSTACVTCANSSNSCTSCNFATNNRWLYNYTCLYLCPNGYEANNVTFVCDQCVLGMYSYENTCYSECPQYYVPNDAIRACVLPGGYPLNMTVQVQNSYTLKFTIPLPLGLDPTLLASLKTNWQSYISLTSVTQDKNILIFNQKRLLQTSLKQLSISNAIIQNNKIILYSTSLNAEQLAHTHSFVARFKDNLISPQNIIYSITSKNTTDSFPYVVNQYFNQNMKPYYLIGIFLALMGLLIVLMRIKYVYRVLIEYIHCIQLIGLTFFAIYPHSAQVNLYSFLLGFDYSNFSFMYNIPLKLIAPCFDCVSLISFSFAVGDMNWLRMMGAILLCAIIMFLFCLIIYVFQCSRRFAKFFVYLVIDLIIIKTVHGWFASLVYAGLNLTYNMQNFDMYILGVHLLSYLLLVPVAFARVKLQSQNKYVNISFIFLIIFVILLVLLSLGPTLICALLILITITQWGIVVGLGVKQQKPQQLQNKIQSSHFSYKYHMHLLRSMKPITAFLVACIIMIQNQVVPIALVSTIFAIFFILIVLDAYFQYAYQDKFAKVSRLNSKSTQSLANQTKQDFKQNQTQYKQNQNVLIFDQNQIDNDDIVGKKFRRNKTNISSQKDKTSQLVKNVQ